MFHLLWKSGKPLCRMQFPGSFARLFILFIILLPGCRQPSAKPASRNIILDVDTSVDDLMTILYFLSCDDITIRAITVEKGVSAVDSGAEIVLRLLELAGHPEIPVARGATRPLEGDNAFPSKWQPAVAKPFGLDLPGHNLETARETAESLMAQLLKTYKNNIDILALGPMTSLAQVFQAEPGLAGNVNQIVVSDGSVYVEGGIHREYPEINNHVAGWNLWVDPAAAAVVFGSGAPVLLVPLDITALHGTDPMVLTAPFAELYGKAARGVIGHSMAVLMKNWIGAYLYEEASADSTKKAPIWDVVAGVVYHHPEVATVWEERHVQITQGEPETAGQIILAGNEAPQTRIILKGSQAKLDSLLLLTAGR